MTGAASVDGRGTFPSPWGHLLLRSKQMMVEVEVGDCVPVQPAESRPE